MKVASLGRFSRIDLSSDSLPFDIAGQLDSASPGSTGPTYVAVAVNGVIRAVTMTWRSRPDCWLATPPLDVWCSENTVEIFAVEEDARGPLLRRAEAADAAQD